MNDVTARVLDHSEWPRVAHLEPFASSGFPPDPSNWLIVVVEADGVVVGCSSVFTAIHWDGFWISPEHQGKAGVFRALVAKGLEELKALGIPGVHTTVPDSRPDLQALVERFGFMPAPGKLYLLHVPDAKI